MMDGFTQLDIRLDGDGAFTDLADRISHRGRLIRVAALEGGMESGLPSVAFAIELEDGSIVFSETSMRLFNAASVAFRGRFGDLS